MAAEVSPPPGIAAGTIAGVLSIVKMSMFFIPVLPSRRMDVGIHIALQIDSLSILSPGASQINRSIRTVAEQAAAVEYIAVRLSIWSGGGCQIAVDLLSFGTFRRYLLRFGCKNFAFLKITDSAAKDKIHISLNVAVFIVMSAHDAGQIPAGADKTARLGFF